jgi:hypothetical protein
MDSAPSSLNIAVLHGLGRAHPSSLVVRSIFADWTRCQSILQYACKRLWKTERDALAPFASFATLA